MKTLQTAAIFIAVLAASGAASARTLMQSAPPLQNQSGPVKSETLKFEPFKGEIVRHQAPLYTGRSAYRDGGHPYRRVGRVGFVPGSESKYFGHGRGYAALVGDRESGLGFYPLQQRYREGAARYRLTHSYYGPYGNPVRQAVIASAVDTYTFLPPTSAVNGYHYGVYDPIEGVGTPFFAGYYSAGTRDPEDGPAPIFGNPLD